MNRIISIVLQQYNWYIAKDATDARGPFTNMDTLESKPGLVITSIIYCYQ